MEYYYDYGGEEELLEVMAGGIGIAAVIFTVLISVAVYVLHAYGIYTIARRRTIHHPWLAWLPVGEMWILGSISDQYQYMVKGKVCSRRKVLLGMSIASCALMIPVFANAVTFMLTVEMGAFAILMALSMVISVLGIVQTVFLYMAYYDLFRSCNPENAVLFLVLGILLNGTLPFFVFAVRKKDQGMPPRRPRPRSAPQPERLNEQTLEQPHTAQEPEAAEQETAQAPGEQTETVSDTAVDTEQEPEEES